MAYYSVMKVACLALALMATSTAMVTAAAQDDLAKEVVDLHNAARTVVGVGPLSWNDSLAAYAAGYAAKRGGDCKLVHSGGPYGENLFWGPTAGGRNWTAADVVGEWVAEKQYYDHASNSCAAGKLCEHYTQVVWRKSTAVGCAYVFCDNNGGLFAICSYYPRGNVVGQSPY